MERAVYSAFFDKYPEVVFLDVLRETLDGLDRKIKKIVLRKFKIFAENRFENSQEEITRQYEEFRSGMMKDYKRIAIQGYCENCDSKQNVAIDYLNLISSTQDNESRVDCPACNANRSIVIPKLDH